MKQLEKILIPTDLSEHSRRALIYGCWLAAEQKASLVARCQRISCMGILF
jgi:hypothetical protein